MVASVTHSPLFVVLHIGLLCRMPLLGRFVFTRKTWKATAVESKRPELLSTS